VESVLTDPAATEVQPRRRRVSVPWLGLILVVLALDIVAFVAFPQTNKDNPGESCAFPACFITNALEFPAAANIIPLTNAEPPGADQLVTFYPAISNTILTMWLVMAVVLLVAIAMANGPKLRPGRAQNAFETFYEFLSDFGTGIAGPTAKPYIPIFVSAFLLVLFDNWVGLIPPVGKLEFLRAPSSDVNVTVGMALIAFLIFEFEGFRRLGVGGYLGKFFPIYEFKNGIGAGVIALFVGLIELMLEFVKPVTLSMRLFGNIYGGEVALGVITTLTVFLLPVGLIGLELMLNAIQALIFSVLTLIFIVLAIESHHEEEGHVAEDVIANIKGDEHTLQPAA
jgi:F-type H+-transporting ATPase subunit a